MAKKEILLPQMGEGVIEATLTKWLKNVGDTVEVDEPIAEVATDKVDTEITSDVDGILTKVFFKEGDIVPVGKVMAVITTEQDDELPAKATGEKDFLKEISNNTISLDDTVISKPANEDTGEETSNKSKSGRFYSPLVKSIATKENISFEELDKIKGSGKDGRVTKDDVLNYLKNRSHAPEIAHKENSSPSIVSSAGDEIIEMDRMRRLIADNMVNSVRTSPHVTSFIDVDVTKIVNWRNKVKDEFFKREGVKLTFTPVFFEAAALALKEFPRINAAVDGYKIILRKDINIGMATALPNGNLIVPVIKNADKKSLSGLTHDVNDLASRARENKLKPDEIMGGTFTITNFGSFDSLTGTPIINQPQVAILAVGAIRKKPVVLETDSGDVIAIRHIVILSMAYDHRIVDGAMGGLFLKKVKEILENWDTNRKI